MNYEEYVSQRKARGLYYVPEHTWSGIMGCGDYEPDPRISPYLDTLLDHSPYVISPRVALHTLNVQHGEATIAGLLADHWSLIKEQNK